MNKPARPVQTEPAVRFRGQTGFCLWLPCEAAFDTTLLQRRLDVKTFCNPRMISPETGLIASVVLRSASEWRADVANSQNLIPASGQDHTPFARADEVIE